MKKAKITIVDQGKIVAARPQHYDDKLKKVTLDVEAAVKKATQNAEIELVVAEVQHKQDMASFRDGLKGSVVVSLLQARIKMAYEARIAGFKCPTWTVDVWEKKLKDLGCSPVTYPAKPEIGESSKTGETAEEAGDGGAGATP